MLQGEQRRRKHRSAEKLLKRQPSSSRSKPFARGKNRKIRSGLKMRPGDKRWLRSAKPGSNSSSSSAKKTAKSVKRESCKTSANLKESDRKEKEDRKKRKS